MEINSFDGKFCKVGSTNGTPVSVGRERSTARQNSFGDSLGDIKYSNHSLEEVAGMVHEIISVYETKVQNAFQELEESNVLRPFMRRAIREISKACSAFEGKDCAPMNAVQTLFTLRTEVMKVFILRLCYCQ